MRIGSSSQLGFLEGYSCTAVLKEESDKSKDSKQRLRTLEQKE